VAKKKRELKIRNREKNKFVGELESALYSGIRFLHFPDF